MRSFEFQVPRRIRFGAGLAARPPAEIGALLGPRVLLVTDSGVHRLGLADPLVAALRNAGAEVAIFSDVLPEPPDRSVHEAVAIASGMRATGVIGFGGGSAMDVAKLAALIAGSGEALDAIYGVELAKGPRLPLLLVPTTAGTGSEATPVAILTAGGAKKGVSSQLLIPDIALLDPDLTLGLPPAITAATGLDAMIHAIEAHSSASPNANPISRGLAREALRLLGAHLGHAVANGSDGAARGAMLLGSCMAGQAFGNAPVAAVHALAYPVGARFHVPRGVSTTLMLCAVMRFNQPACAADYAEIATDISPDLIDTPLPQRAAALIDALHRLARSVNLPTTLREIGVSDSDLSQMADAAMLQTRLLVNNPRPVTREDALAIYRDALG
ncbi:iron-containing alcohol dehydrogenase [Acetobacteraceae bacterium KSS8]|uniref:Iron-containing alcohol dehydrogenase n=1 Tax=Endosaccharibacter trunci TaxID=2812733 RepID=A0ABT1W596_9PROT|nr:iron-containing alcohol dehydrogenase [Acetobacteraceae bacterium KSS8]